MWKKDNKLFSNPLVFNGRKIFNPTNSQLIDAGYIWEDDPVPERPEIDYTAFNMACGQFRDVCKQIGDFIGVPEFKGGFDEYSIFINSTAAVLNPSKAALLAAMWSGANEYCIYEASKLNIGQPEWWYKCWDEKEL